MFIFQWVITAAFNYSQYTPLKNIHILLYHIQLPVTPPQVARLPMAGEGRSFDLLVEVLLPSPKLPAGEISA